MKYDNTSPSLTTSQYAHVSKLLVLNVLEHVYLYYVEDSINFNDIVYSIHVYLYIVLLTILSYTFRFNYSQYCQHLRGSIQLN